MTTTASKTATKKKANSRGATETKRTSAIQRVPGNLKVSDILVPTDFSEPSKKAVRYAVAFAKQFGAKLTLVHVVEIPVYPPEFAYLAFENDRLTNAAKEKLDTFAKQHVEEEVLQKTLVRTGKPHQEITSAARTLKSDLIIISTHGYTGLKHALLGSTAERVVRNASCPVLVVRQ